MMREQTVTPNSTLLNEGQINYGQIRRDMVVRRLGKIGFYFNPIFAYFFLWAPILVLVVFSFNKSSTVSVWGGFTTEWYARIFNGTDSQFTSNMLGALRNTLFIAVISTIFSTVIGTMVSLALERYRFPGKKAIDGLLYLPVVIPEITQAVSLAVFFKFLFDLMETLSGTRATYGFGTIIIGHVAFNISYVAIVVRARLANMNPRLEEAANDLGANTWQTFRRITLPLILPGIVAGGLLALTLSMDDLVVTFFNAGVGTTTLPLFVYGLIKTAVTPEVNALSTLMLVFSTVIVGVSLYLQNKYTERPYTRR